MDVVTEASQQHNIVEGALGRMFDAGAHFGVTKSRRHPSTRKYVFGTKQHVDIVDLSRTEELLEAACSFVRELGAAHKTLLFVGGKPESQRIVRAAAERVGAPYVVGRWIGGTITNFEEIKKRISRLESLRADRESGALGKYTKLERLLIDREIARLESMYGGLTNLGNTIPHALFVVDPKREVNAVREARTRSIPVIALANTDCDLSPITYPIPANDAAPRSITFFTNELANAYEEGLESAPMHAPAPNRAAAHDVV